MATPHFWDVSHHFYGLKHSTLFCIPTISVYPHPLYVVINSFLFRIDTHKDNNQDKGNFFLLVIPEKYEPIILHTYHDSLLAGYKVLLLLIRWSWFCSFVGI